MLKVTIKLVLWNLLGCQNFNSSQKIIETTCQGDLQSNNCCQDIASQNNITLNFCQNISNYDCQALEISEDKINYLLPALIGTLGFFSCSLLVFFLFQQRKES